MKRALPITAALAALVGIAVAIGGGTAGGQPGPTPTLGPFTPTFSYTFDEVAPDNPDILPADDECPVGALCKFLWWAEIPDGQPSAAISGAGLTPPVVVAFANPAVVPDGAIIGKVFFLWRQGPMGRCATEGSIVGPFQVTVVQATTDPTTTTGSRDDLCSFSHWPTQLNGVTDAFLATHPGSVLWSRAVPDRVDCWPGAATNILVFAPADGTGSAFVAVGGDPTSPDPPTTETCGPWSVKYLGLGLSADNPNTPEDEGGIPLHTCVAAGTHTVRASLDRNDTPPGDAVTVEDTAVCSPNTPAGSGVSVPLNGGSGVLGGIIVAFSGVSAGGSTSVITTTTGPPPPTGFKIVGLAELPLYFDINTDATYAGDLTVCIRYDESQVAGPEANLKLMQRVDGFVNITTSVDTANDVICGTTTHLSIFVVTEPVPIAVGGVARELPRTSGVPLQAAGSSGGNSGVLIGLIAAATGAVLALGGVAWYARRRWLS